MKTFLTLMKREYWENRGGFVWAPTIVVGLFGLFFFMGLIAAAIHLSNAPAQLRDLPLDRFIGNLRPDQIATAGNTLRHILGAFGLCIQIVLGVVLFFYLLGSLHDDRKDRSILFWKSMPVSDFSTLLSKYLSAAIVAPVFSWLAVIVLHLMLLIMVSLFLLMNGVTKFGFLWTEADLPGMWLRMFVGIPVNALWALPAFGWLMMVSSWSRALPFLWALFTPIVVGIMLTIIDFMSSLQIPESWFWIHMFCRGILGVVPWTFASDKSSFGFNFDGNLGPYDLYSWHAMGQALTSAELWIGAVVGLAMLGVAFYFRRYREIAD